MLVCLIGPEMRATHRRSFWDGTSSFRSTLILRLRLWSDSFMVYRVLDKFSLRGV